MPKRPPLAGPRECGASLDVYTLIVYTEVVLDKIEGFDWDNANVGHILRHAVTPFEVEEVTGGKYVVIPVENRQTREAMKAVWQDGIRAVPGLVFTIRRNECPREEQVCPGNRLT